MFGILKKKPAPKPKEPTPIQMVLRSFKGKNYLDLDDDERDVIVRLRQFGFIDYDFDGNLFLTQKGKDFASGKIKTNENYPSFLDNYVAKLRS